jgi:hypothetical protein
MVIAMNWQTKYTTRIDFMNLFDNEQDFIDAMFMQIVMFNFGVFLNTEDLIEVR